MTAMKTEPTGPIEKLTEKAIDAQLAAIGRKIKTQEGYKADADAEIRKLLAERATLIGARIDWLKKQMDDGESGGGGDE